MSFTTEQDSPAHSGAYSTSPSNSEVAIPTAYRGHSKKPPDRRLKRRPDRLALARTCARRRPPRCLPFLVCLVAQRAVRRRRPVHVVQVGRVHGVGRGRGHDAALVVDVDIGLVAGDEAGAERNAGRSKAERPNQPRAVADPPRCEDGERSDARPWPGAAPRSTSSRARGRRPRPPGRLPRRHPPPPWPRPPRRTRPG